MGKELAHVIREIRCFFITDHLLEFYKGGNSALFFLNNFREPAPALAWMVYCPVANTDRHGPA